MSTTQTATAPPLAVAAGGGAASRLPLQSTKGDNTTMITETALAAALLLTPASATERAAQLPPAQEQYRECVAERESNDNPRARNRNSSAAGKYQFLDSQWRRGLAYMVAAELREHGHPEPRAVRKELQRKPINKWPERYQDVAFAAVLNAEGPWSGVKHWRLVGSSCNKWVKR